MSKKTHTKQNKKPTTCYHEAQGLLDCRQMFYVELWEVSLKNIRDQVIEDSKLYV